MLTVFLYALLAIAVIAGLFALVAFVLPKGEQISPPAPDVRPWAGLPDHRLTADDVVATRLPVAVRGYRFAETDLLLDRLTDELRERDEEIARLRAVARVPARGDAPGDGSGEVSDDETADAD